MSDLTRSTRNDPDNPPEMFCPSVDVCAICGDVYCDGILCISGLDSDVAGDQAEIEQIQTWIRLGRIQEQANDYLAVVENRAHRTRARAGVGDTDR